MGQLPWILHTHHEGRHCSVGPGGCHQRRHHLQWCSAPGLRRWCASDLRRWPHHHLPCVSSPTSPNTPSSPSPTRSTMPTLDTWPSPLVPSISPLCPSAVLAPMSTWPRPPALNNLPFFLYHALQTPVLKQRD